MELKKLLGDVDHDCPPEISEVVLTIRDLEFERDDLKGGVVTLRKRLHELATDWQVIHAKYEDARSIIDGCYEVVELFEAKTPSQIEWKRKWLEAARKHGASSCW